MALLEQNNWFVAGYGNAMPKEDDLLSQKADVYYAKIATNKVQTPQWGRFPVLQTPWPYPGQCVPLEVFHWAMGGENV